MKKNRLDGIFQARRSIEKEVEPPPAQREAEEAGRILGGLRASVQRRRDK